MARSFARPVISGIAVSACAFALWLLSGRLQAQNSPTFKAKVDLVVLSFTVETSHGDYVNGLKPADFRILEDGISQKISTFAQGNRPAVRVMGDGSVEPIVDGQSPNRPEPAADPPMRSMTGNNVFLLFDTSNFMYRNFVYAEEAITDFIRGIDDADSIAVYTFSRNLTRASILSRNHSDALTGLRKAVAGDDTALYNGLLLTLRDAAKVPGRKAVIVFSNGPDNASMVAPDDLRVLAEDEGIPIYVISTNEVANDPVTGNIFRRLTSRTGGKAYWAGTWQQQERAFTSIRQDLGNSYTVTYYPAPNANEGFRKITVELVNDNAKKLRVRARPGYRPHKS